MYANSNEKSAKNNELLTKPVWQMTGAEFLSLLESSGHTQEREEPVKQQNFAYGLYDLAGKLGCGISTVNSLKKDGVLEDAIYSRVGSKMVFDVDVARDRINKFRIKNNQRRGAGR